MSKTTFAETRQVYPGSQENVIQPDVGVMEKGFVPEYIGGTGQSLPANWLNWLFREIFRLFRRDVVSDGSGTGLFPNENQAIELLAFDRDDSSKYLHAVGYKPQTGVHSLNIISANGLALGTPTADGAQPVTGGSNVVTIGKSRS